MNRLIHQLRRGLLAKLFALAILIGTASQLGQCLKYLSLNHNDEKLKEIQQLVKDTPVFPDFKEVDTHSISKDDRAGVYKYYHSNASYDEVKDFYLKTLGVRGWEPGSEETRMSGNKLLSFRKGEFLITIEYTDDNEFQNWHDYSISYDWSPREDKIK